MSTAIVETAAVSRNELGTTSLDGCSKANPSDKAATDIIDSADAALSHRTNVHKTTQQHSY